MIYLKGRLHLQTKNPQYNIYALLHRKKKYKFLILYILLFLLCLSLLFIYQIEETIRLQGLYECKKNDCTIKVLMPYSIAKNLKESNKLWIKSKKYPLKVKEFGSIEVIQNVAYETVSLEIPKLEFYDKETIDVTLIEDKKSLMEILIKTLKGGEDP